MPDGIVPAPQAEPAWYGLLSVADVVNHNANDERWTSGVSWAPEVCSNNVRLIDICSPIDPEVIVEAGGPETRVAPGFGIDVTDICTTTFGLVPAERRARLRRAVEAVTDKAVERALWSGFADSYPDGERYPSFTQSGAEVLGSGPVPVLEAISLLEDAFARDLGIRGTIHASRRAGAYLVEKCRIEEAELVTTKLGSKVVLGTGYELTGPNDAAPAADAAWIFGTGPISVHLGPIVQYEAPDVRTNDIPYHAERPAAVVWDSCMLYAVQIELG